MNRLLNIDLQGRTQDLATGGGGGRKGKENA